MVSTRRYFDLGRLDSVVVPVVFAAIVVGVATLHEPWRDEVVALNIAREAGSLAELIEPLKFESHPILWYLVLWVSYAAIRSTVVLKAASLLSAIGSVVLVSRSQLPWWFRWVFPFTFFPVYQYSVVCRGYGLEMFVLFSFCALYPYRAERPVAAACALAALANTEAFGFIMAVGAGIMLAVECLLGDLDWRRLAAQRRGKLAAVVYLTGLALSVAVAFPDPTHNDSSVRELALDQLASVIGWAILQPAAHLEQITFLPMPSLWLWAYLVYLTRRPPLLCYAAVGFFGIATFFNIFPYLAAPWRTGNAILLLVSVMWLDAARPRPSAANRTVDAAYTWLGRGLAAALVFMLAGQLWLGARNIAAETEADHSASRLLADVLNRDPRYRDAILLGEPDLFLLSLPYYADNRIYLARESTHRPWAVFGPQRRKQYSLGELLETARRLGNECGCPIVLAMSIDPERLGAHVYFAGTPYEQEFTITGAQRQEFRASTQLIAKLRTPTITDESYDVYVLH